ncbi:MAG: 3-dehydroquinate synthase [Lachnospiraceae bacterium]|nr:3-dehydroquinate synthase [Lachnospiraceae bacterium]
MMEKMTVNYENKPCYDVIIDDSLASFPKELIREGSRICIVTDDNVANACLDEVKKEIFRDALVFCIKPGEESKNLDTVKDIYAFLVKNDFSRTDMLVALGGGVVGDITGFVAATFKRGISFIQIPTSLLAMVDSSVGGKTGVDFDSYKNMIGAFYMPKHVYINVSFLKKLPDREFFNGFAEAMKSALIRDGIYYSWMIDKMYEICEKDPETLIHLINGSVSIKKTVVEQDPKEESLRMILNFGHTVGHAIEKYKGFELKHGECVALGCVCAAFISWKRDYLTMEEYYEIRDMFVPFNLPISTEMLDIDEVMNIMQNDKKVIDGKLRFILLKKIGKAVIENDVTEDEIRASLNEINFDEAW